MPSDASFFDTLALASLLSPEGARQQGLERRLVQAQRAKEDAINRATRALDPFTIDRGQIATLVEKHISEAGERLRKTLLK
jgi:hypothetical protein